MGHDFEANIRGRGYKTLTWLPDLGPLSVLESTVGEGVDGSGGWT